MKLTVPIESVLILVRDEIMLGSDGQDLARDALAAHAWEMAVEECERGSRLIDGTDMLRKLRDRQAAILEELLQGSKV